MIVILLQEGNLIKRHIMSVSSFSPWIGVDDNQCVIYINSPDILSHFPLSNNSKYFNHQDNNFEENSESLSLVLQSRDTREL